MAIALPGLDQLSPGPSRDFAEALHALYDLAGQPGARVISQGIRQDRNLRETVSHETVSSALRGDSLPGWGKIYSIIVVLARESVDQHDLPTLVRNFHTLWLAARAAKDPRPSSPGASGAATTTAVAAPLAALETAEDRDAGTPGPPLPRISMPEMTWQVSTGLATTPNGQIIGGLPDRNLSFVGRELLLDALQDGLLTFPNHPLVVQGVGGCGKTQLACEYVHRFKDYYPVIWWVLADSVDQARTSLVTLAERLQVPIHRSADQTIADLLSRLDSSDGRYLLVFDGVADPDIRDLVPSRGGDVIVTTRDPSIANDSSRTPLRVPDFDHAEAIQFLRERDSELSARQAEEVLGALGHLPLALEQIVALRTATRRSWSDLLAELAQPSSGLLSSGQPPHYPQTVSASLQLALGQLAANPAARQVFELFAWFGSEPVSTTLLRDGRSGNVSAPLSRTFGNPIELAKAVAAITRYGLASLRGQTRIEVQPLTRLALRDVLSADALARAQHNVHEILAAADPGWPDDLATLDMHKEIAAHVTPAGLVSARTPAAHATVLNQIRYRYQTGDLVGACSLGEAAVTTWRDEAFLGPGHDLVLLATREWANALRAAGQFDQSRDLTMQAMRRLSDDPRFGDDHPYTLAMATSHAADLRIAGRYAEALRLDQETHRRYTQLRGEGDRLTASSHHNVAVSLRLVGNFAAAELMDREEVNRHRATLGEEHVTTLLAINALAEDLYGLGRYREALELQQPYLRSGVTIEPSRLAALRAARTVALALGGLGDLPSAIEMFRNQYYGSIELFGPDHEHTVVVTMSYANYLRQSGQPHHAYPLARDAVNTYRRMFGPQNPLSLAAAVNLAAILRAQGARGEARQADSVARDGLRSALGDTHPYTVAATVGLAADAAAAGDHARARSLSEEAHRAAAVSHGAAHPEVLVAAANLSLDLRATGAVEQADTLLKTTLGRLRRSLGADHPTVTQVASGLRIEIGIEPPSN